MPIHTFYFQHRLTLGFDFLYLPESNVNISKGLAQLKLQILILILILELELESAILIEQGLLIALQLRLTVYNVFYKSSCRCLQLSIRQSISKLIHGCVGVWVCGCVGRRLPLVAAGCC